MKILKITSFILLLFTYSCSKEDEGIKIKDINTILCDSPNPTGDENPVTEQVKLGTREDGLHVMQNLLINCCTEKLNVQLVSCKNNIINVDIADSGELCNCICMAEISYSLENLVKGQSYELVITRNGQEYFSTTYVFSPN